MTDAHYHRGAETLLSLHGREFRFFGVHPWNAETVKMDVALTSLRKALE